MELRNGGKRVGKALRSQVQQCLHENIDLQGVEGRLDHIVLGRFPRVGQILQLVQHIFRGALLTDSDHQFVGSGSSW